MARYRKNPINPFLEFLMDQSGIKDESGRLSLQTMQRQTGENWASITGLADCSGKNNTLHFHLRMSEYFGITLDEWARGLLGELSEVELQRIKNQISKAS